MHQVNYPTQSIKLLYNTLLYIFIIFLNDIGAGSGNRTRTLSLEGSYDTISPYPLSRLR